MEWQKRGLPHIHLLVWLKEKLRPSEIDLLISAELPDKIKDPELYDVVVSNMIHGPCGALNPRSPCMKERSCTKNYPRQLISETQTGEDGYPLYRRRSEQDGGFTHMLEKHNQKIKVDNGWVVPYCPLLS